MLTFGFWFKLPILISHLCDTDVSTTMIVTPGPVFDFLLTNQNVRDIRDIDWPRVHDNIPLSEIPAFLFSHEANLKLFTNF